MRRLQAGVAATVLIGIAALPAGAEQYVAKGSGRVSIAFNAGWLFAARDIANGQALSLKESSFKPICLPHTTTVVKHCAIDTSSFALVTWYRKHFTPPAACEGKRFIIEFQAVSTVAAVYVNEAFVGEHKGAYTPFSFDITDKVKRGADNLLAVRVDSRQHKDIPPEGGKLDYLLFGGIVRDVVMTLVDRLHVEWVYVSRDTLSPDRVIIKTRVVNCDVAAKQCAIVTTVADCSATIVGRATDALTVAADSSVDVDCAVGPLSGPRLWDPDHPYLYTVHTRLLDGATPTDEYAQRFGIRSISLSKTDGAFSINGRRLKLRGLNRHETYPFIGRAAADRLQRKDADIIKFDMGCNVVRCSHYPQSPAFLDRCDEIGLLVLEEMPGWMYVGPAPQWQKLALKSLEEMIVRDRNHPSIISFGVRINESSDSRAFYRKTNWLARTLDPGRPTHGVRVLGRGSAQDFFEDIWVYNYAVPAGKPPMLPWITGEHGGHLAPAHSWDDQRRLIYQMLYHAAVLDSAEANPKIAGLLGWCAFDYNSAYEVYSEKTICYHGVADIFRLPKPAAWLYRSQADPAVYGPMVYIAHDWKNALNPNDVWVASNCDSVELFVNGTSLGRRGPDRYTHLQRPLFKWGNVAFRPGELSATGYIGGAVAATAIRKTPGAPARLTMVADDTLLFTGGDMTKVVVAAVDASGQAAPRASSMVSIAVDGPADFLGEAPIALENGKTAFFIQTRAGETGSVRCVARAKGLGEGSASIAVIAYKEIPR